MKAKKENKVYTIDESQKQTYLDQGYDIYDNDGNLIEDSPLKSISVAEHKKAIEEAKADSQEQIKNLMKSNEELADQLKSNQVDITDKTVLDILKEYATAKNIDIGSSTSAKGILDKILEVEKV